VKNKNFLNLLCTGEFKMKTTMLVKLFAVAVATTAIIAANSASAQQRMLISNPGPQPLLLQPGFQPEVPKLGFFGYTTFRGMVVTRVMPGTEASRIGLERGDMIISVNGFPAISRPGAIAGAGCPRPRCLPGSGLPRSPA